MGFTRHLFSVHLCFPRVESGRLVVLTVRIHRTRKLEVRGAVPLLHLCLYGVDRDTYNLFNVYDIMALFNVELNVTIVVKGNYE